MTRNSQCSDCGAPANSTLYNNCCECCAPKRTARLNATFDDQDYEGTGSEDTDQGSEWRYAEGNDVA